MAHQLECISNAGCSTGYCDEGRCSTPQVLEPCKPNQCGREDLVCEAASQRCMFLLLLPDVYKRRKLGVCDMSVDCDSHSYCDIISHTCKELGNLGAFCPAYFACGDGLSCDDNTCKRRCQNDHDCGPYESCKRLEISHTYKICQPQPNRHWESNSSQLSVVDPLLLIGIIMFVLGIATLVIWLWYCCCRRPRRSSEGGASPFPALNLPSQPPQQSTYYGLGGEASFPTHPTMSNVVYAAPQTRTMDPLHPPSPFQVPHQQSELPMGAPPSYEEATPSSSMAQQSFEKQS